MRAILLPFLLLTLGGCATLSPEECRTADWREVGFQDGAKGREADFVRLHKRACERLSITPDYKVYREGRKAGLLQFCIPSVGYKEGLEGNSYGGVCPVEREEAFLAAYQQGRVIHDIYDDIGYHRSEISELHRKIGDLRDEIDLLDAGDGKAEERLGKIRSLKRRIRRQGRLIEDHYEAIYDLEHELDHQPPPVY